MTNRPEGEGVDPTEPGQIDQRLQQASQELELQFAKWPELEQVLQNRPDLSRLLNFESIKQNLDHMKRLSGRQYKNKDELWVYLSSGFSQNYFHDLFRAELLLSSYPSDDESWKKVSKIIQNTARTVKELLAFVDVELVDHKIFGPVSDTPDIRGADPALTQVPEIRKAVLAKGTSGNSYVVDVKVFDVNRKGSHIGNSREIISSPADWL
jgi:hypothetical protein